MLQINSSFADLHGMACHEVLYNVAICDNLIGCWPGTSIACSPHYVSNHKTTQSFIFLLKDGPILSKILNGISTNPNAAWLCTTMYLYLHDRRASLQEARKFRTIPPHTCLQFSEDPALGVHSESPAISQDDDTPRPSYECIRTDE